jgi:hypothetical protein
MNEEIKLGCLSLTDKRELVLTLRHVFQHQDRGIFGESHEIIPRHAITTVRISWQRSRGLVVLGTIFLITFLVLMIGSIVPEPVRIPEWEQTLNLSPFAASLIRYGSLVSGIAIFILFWFHKRNEIHIMAPTTTLGGIPRSYEEAEKFCFLMDSAMKDQAATAENEPSSPKTADHDWKL